MKSSFKKILARNILKGKKKMNKFQLKKSDGQIKLAFLKKLTFEDIDEVLRAGKHAVIPLDMCGAIAMKRHFPTAIIFINKDKENLIREIIEEDYTTEEKTLRILSIDAEKRNREICDYIVDNNEGKGAEIVSAYTR